MMAPLLVLVRWFECISYIRTFAAVASVYRTIHHIDRFICMRCTIGQHRVDNTHQKLSMFRFENPLFGISGGLLIV